MLTTERQRYSLKDTLVLYTKNKAKKNAPQGELALLGIDEWERPALFSFRSDKQGGVVHKQFDPLKEDVRGYPAWPNDWVTSSHYLLDADKVKGAGAELISQCRKANKKSRDGMRRPLRCKWDGCGQQVDDITQKAVHESSCTRNPAFCGFCSCVIIDQPLTAHKKECPHNPNVCEYCKRKFETASGKNGHLRACAKKFAASTGDSPTCSEKKVCGQCSTPMKKNQQKCQSEKCKRNKDPIRDVVDKKEVERLARGAADAAVALLLSRSPSPANTSGAGDFQKMGDLYEKRDQARKEHINDLKTHVSEETLLKVLKLSLSGPGGAQSATEKRISELELFKSIIPAEAYQRKLQEILDSV